MNESQYTAAMIIFDELKRTLHLLEQEINDAAANFDSLYDEYVELEEANNELNEMVEFTLAKIQKDY